MEARSVRADKKEFAQLSWASSRAEGMSHREDDANVPFVLTQSEFEARLPVWHALSDLFLDTELRPADYRHMADMLRGSRYSPAELRAILEKEVAPAFAPNLFSVAGEWAGWTEQDVREIMLRSLAPRFSLTRWLNRRLSRRFVAAEWAKLDAALSEEPEQARFDEKQ